MSNASDADRLPKEIVRDGWNHASTKYRLEDASADAFGHTVDEHAGWLRPLMTKFPPGARVLDLGCGMGVPDVELLSGRFQVLGVDISDEQIRRARIRVPNAEFLRADMTELQLAEGRFSGIVCLYALIHVPLLEQRPLLGRIYRWLAPDGLVLITTGHQAFTGTEENWLGSGATMYWSHADAATYRAWFHDLGFEIQRQETIPEGTSSHELFLLKKGNRLGRD